MRILAVAAVALLALAAPASAEVSVGVTAAVNPQATGAVGSNVRTIALGDSVVFNERIQTSAEGLVQILLADGTTFMVGPNSDLTIDSFVYDPAANTAQVTASFTKGVLRFIGGQTSKTDDGVTLNTPVGTMGIRGAVVDVVLDPPAGTPPHIDMLFGNEVTLEQGQQLLGRLYAGGYSLVLGGNGAFEVMKTPPGWSSQIQAALAGQPGTRGGAPAGPSDGDVGNSELAENNSGQGPAGEPLSPAELRQLLEAAALYDQLRDFILNNQGQDGLTGGVVFLSYDWPDGYWDEGEDYYYDESRSPFLNAIDPDTEEALLSTVVFDPNGVPVSINVPIALTGSNCEGTCGQAYYLGTDGSGQLVVEINNNEGVYTTSNSYLKDHTEYLDEQQLAGLELDCESCADFVRWGFWGFTGTEVTNGAGVIDIELESTWISANLTTRAQLDNLAAQSESGISAYYHGDAVGVVNNAAVEGSYVASGNLDMEWNFGSRTGNASITAFDTENFSGSGRGFYYELAAPEGNATFLGNLTSTDNPYADSFGGMQGAFANHGSDVAGGVIGNWGISEYNWENYTAVPDYTVGGIFMGESYNPGN